MIENYIIFVSLLVSDSEATQIFKYKGFLVFDTALRMYKHYEYVPCSIKAAWHSKLFLQKIPQKNTLWKKWSQNQASCNDVS